MILSEQRISHLAHRIKDGLWRDDLVDFPDEARALQILKEAMSRFLAADEEVAVLVRNRLQRQHKVPGSNEWRVLYERYFREEMARRGW